MNDVTSRFWEKVDKSGECWLWTACVVNKYGQFAIKHGRRTLAHRFAYEATVGPIPEGTQLDHLCRNPLCVRPSHLEVVTPLENTRRGMSPTTILRRSGRCRRGHSLADAYAYPDGTRHCRVCRSQYNRDWKAARAVAS